MSFAEAFADWGRDEARREDPVPPKDRRPAHLHPVPSAETLARELVLVVRIEFTEDDIGA